jgi:hypothetical protein
LVRRHVKKFDPAAALRQAFPLQLGDLVSRFTAELDTFDVEELLPVRLIPDDFGKAFAQRLAEF